MRSATEETEEGNLTQQLYCPKGEGQVREKGPCNTPRLSIDDWYCRNSAEEGQDHYNGEVWEEITQSLLIFVVAESNRNQSECPDYVGAGEDETFNVGGDNPSLSYFRVVGKPGRVNFVQDGNP